MLIYRLEDKNHVGPFHSNEILDDGNGFYIFPSSCVGYPDTPEDHGIKKVPTFCIFGWKSLDLVKCFIRDRVKLEKMGFVIKVYEFNGHKNMIKVFSDGQVMFNRSAKIVDTLPLTY